MADDRERVRALVVAVAEAVKSRLGSPDWVKVAAVMQHLSPDSKDPWDRGKAYDWHRRAVKGLTPEAVAAIVATVVVDSYKDTLTSVLEHGGAPAGAPPVIPGVNVQPPVPKEKEEPKEPKEPDTKADILIRKLQMRADFYKQGYEKLLKEQATAEMLVDAIKETVVAAEPVPPIPLPAPTVVLWNRPRRMMPILSDAHVGEEVDGAKIKGFNHHNFHVLDEKLDMWCTYIEEQFQYQRSLGPVEMIQIPVLGDMVTGEDIYKNQKAHIEATAMHQIFIGAEKFEAAFLRIARLGVLIEIPCVFGNHGRMGAKGESDFSNDIIMYKHLEAKLCNQPNIRFKIDWAFWEVTRHWDWRFYMCHGDNIKGWAGFPWYGQARADANTLMLMLTQGMWYHFFMHGHCHTDMSLQTPIGRRLANGNWLGTTEYGVNGGFGGRPSQKLLIITQENGIEQEMPIYLDRIEPDFMKKMIAQAGT